MIALLFVILSFVFWFSLAVLFAFLRVLIMLTIFLVALVLRRGRKSEPEWVSRLGRFSDRIVWRQLEKWRVDRDVRRWQHKRREKKGVRQQARQNNRLRREKQARQREARQKIHARYGK